MSGNTELFNPFKWYALTDLRDRFKLNYDILLEAVKSGELAVIQVGSITKTLGMEFQRFSLKLLYGNNMKRAETACKLAGVNIIKPKIVE